MEQAKDAKQAEMRPLTDEETEQVAGGLPILSPSSYECRKCKKAFPDAGTYFEHMKMVHGG